MTDIYIYIYIWHIYIYVNIYTHQDDGDVPWRVDAADVLVQRLHGAVTAVVGDGEHHHVAVGPVDGPEGTVVNRGSSSLWSYEEAPPPYDHIQGERSHLLICSWQYRPSASSCRTRQEQSDAI